ncbi:hypothetical protein IBX35_02910 [Candidatus Bathyarchaeota archaeon]|nr:hypothetical protein [Candidatus Bathyarchaeota archaeon]
MKLKIDKILSLLFIAMLVLSVSAVGIPRVLASPTDVVVVPSLIELPREPGLTGTEFTVTVEIHDVLDLYGVDIQFGWDTEWIGYVSHTAKIPVETYPDGIMHEPPGGFWVRNDVDETASMPGAEPETMFWLAYASMYPAAPFDGSGIAFEMTFVVKKQPDEALGEPDAVITLKITSSTLADSTGTAIEHERYDGTVIIPAAPWVRPEGPLLKVMPETVDGMGISNTFESDVYLTGVDPYWDVAGFDIVYNFDPMLIEAVSVTIDPDGWFASFWPSGILIVRNEIDNTAGTVWVVFLGIPSEGGEHTEVYGEGRLFTVTFHEIYEAPVHPPETCSLALSPTIIAGYPHPERSEPPYYNKESAIPVPHTVEHGFYKSKLKLLGAVIDLFTQYPAPYGGQGPDLPSDMFWPQKEVVLYAKVTYNDWPEQMKDVAFEVKDPHGTVWGIFYDRTDAVGIASVSFRLPWPCDDPDYYKGEWKVFATVDVACEVINDTLTFKYDYLVNIWKVTTDMPNYAHCEDILVTIEYGSWAMQYYDVVFTVTIVDETGVPFGFTYVMLTVGGAQYCVYKNDTVSLSIHVPKFARAGIATIYVGALSDFPQCGGCALCPLYTPPPTIGIKAAWA